MDVSSLFKAFLVGCTITVIAFFTLSSLATIQLLLLLVNQGNFTGTQIVSAGVISLFSSPFSQPPTLIIPIVLAAIAIGGNAVLMYLLWVRTKAFPKNNGGVAGFFAALFGAGCAACGPVLGATLLASIGGASLVALFPFGGQEIGYFGVLLLALSAFSLYRALKKPLVCV